MCSTSNAEEPDRKRPVVCFDESPTQLIGEVRQPIKAEPGQLERCGWEYKRDGTANLFIFLDVHRPWRKVKVTDSRTAVDFAACIQDVHFRKAERIRVVLDNLSIHTVAALYQAFPPAEPWRLPNRLEFPQARQLFEHGRKSRLAFCAVNAWVGASTARSGLYPKLLPGSGSAIRHASA
jgi:hypothetical protein